ncbi:MAG: type III-A CRISPR-associated protein Csm2 [Desulfobacteraceae bacterium 4572_187]|nr:MAG: type III-A CRISPR-associated protein Csm2 [Desulfobacteraceae bacterium 4572_187]
MDVEKALKSFFQNNDEQFGAIPAAKIVTWAENCKVARDLNKSTTATQLRRFYDAIRSIWDTPDQKKLDGNNNLKEEYLARLIFLKPAFVGAANKNKIGDEFKNIMCLSIDRVKNKEDFYKFIKFFEAIIQYSK